MPKGHYIVYNTIGTTINADNLFRAHGNHLNHLILSHHSLFLVFPITLNSTRVLTFVTTLNTQNDATTEFLG